MTVVHIARLRVWSVIAVLTGGCVVIPGRVVRYEPTAMPVVRQMLHLAAVGPQDVVYDLGSGDGRIPITAAAEYGARGVGIEIDPDLVATAQANARAAGVQDRVEFRLGDMFAADLRQATVVTLFLHPRPNLRLRPRLQADLRPGARVVSYMWNMGDWRPDDEQRTGRHMIFLWRMPPASRRSGDLRWPGWSGGVGRFRREGSRRGFSSLYFGYRAIAAAG